MSISLRYGATNPHEALKVVRPYYVVTQNRSSIHAKPLHRGSLRALGLRRVGQSVVAPATPSIVGTIRSLETFVVVLPIDLPSDAPGVRVLGAIARRKMRESDSHEDRNGRYPNFLSRAHSVEDVPVSTEVVSFAEDILHDLRPDITGTEAKTAAREIADTVFGGDFPDEIEGESTEGHSSSSTESDSRDPEVHPPSTI